MSQERETDSEKAGDPEVPSFWAYMPATIEALRARSGSATVQDLLEDVPARMGLTPEQRAVPHDSETSGQTEVGYRLAWARTYLKKAGLIHSPARGTWALTPQGMEARDLDGRALAREIRAQAPKPQAES